jgi:hypothetical protein
MSKEEGAAMFDKISVRTKMSSKDRMAMMDKKSVDDKGDAYDKVIMSKMDKGAMNKYAMEKPKQ